MGARAAFVYPRDMHPPDDKGRDADDVSGSLRVWYVDGEGGPERAGEIVSASSPKPGVHHLRVARTSGEFTLGLALPRGAASPLSVGMRLQTRIRHEVIGIHPVANACVTEESGAVLLACSGRGAPEFAPGWTIAVGPELRRAGGRVEFWVALEHVDRRVYVAANAWRRLDAAGASWLVCGHAVGWDPRQPLPPDASSYHCYWILRA